MGNRMQGPPEKPQPDKPTEVAKKFNPGDSPYEWELCEGEDVEIAKELIKDLQTWIDYKESAK